MGEWVEIDTYGERGRERQRGRERRRVRDREGERDRGIERGNTCIYIIYRDMTLEKI